MGKMGKMGKMGYSNVSKKRRNAINIYEYNIEKEFVRKYESINSARKELRMSHSTIKKYSLSNEAYKGRILALTELKTEGL